MTKRTNGISGPTVFLLALLAAPIAWAQGGHERALIPRVTNSLGMLLEIHSIHWPVEIQNQAIVIYRDPLGGNFAYLTIPSRYSERGARNAGDHQLDIGIDKKGSLTNVLLWEDESWISIQPLEAELLPKITKIVSNQLPGFNVVPARDHCTGTYLGSAWQEGFGNDCLMDWYDCSDSLINVGYAACCFDAVGATPDCEDFGLTRRN